MFILLHCAGMPFNGSSIETGSLGGSETSAYYVARGLAAKGHRVTIFTTHPEDGEWDGVRYCSMGAVNDQFPLGEAFTYYATHTPCDALIIQRHPLAFRNRWASKVNIWWTHDLALKRVHDHVHSMLWNTDAIFTVSEWHKRQVMEAWGVTDKVVRPITNGIDRSLWARETHFNKPIDIHRYRVDRSQEFALLYAARPERGFVNLVKPNGIMAQLWERNKNIHLYFCSYDNNVPTMQADYRALLDMAKALPNCTNLGALTKHELAVTEQMCDLYVYPTTFEDTSCIMAMECAAAGLPMLSSLTGAVPETVGEGGGTEFIDLKDGEVDVEEWVKQIDGWAYDKDVEPRGLEKLQHSQLEKAPCYDWEHAVDCVEEHIMSLIRGAQKNSFSMLRHLVNMSDYYAAKEYAKQITVRNAPLKRVLYEIEHCYYFAANNDWKRHYEEYYQYEKNRGVVYGPEDLSNNFRFTTVANIVGGLPDGSLVLDYGCAHGHYTNNLAKAFPRLQFIGVDIAESNIEAARQWACDSKLDNVAFVCDEAERLELDIKADAVIVAEVLEHVEAPWDLVDELRRNCTDDALFIATTPYGPWEEQGYEEHYPWRAHVHHFERSDLKDVWGDFPEFNIKSVPAGHNTRGEPLGSYVFTFRGDSALQSGRVDYSRKLALTVPRQTVSLCLIVRNAEETLKRSLEAVRGVVDEILIGVDETTDDRTKSVIEDFISDTKLWPMVRTVQIPSPLETGFDEARNSVIKKAQGDWILWIDADEIVVHATSLFKYLRNNMYAGYAMKQHHFAVEPLGVIKTDIPARLFRNHMGIKFFGVVHEHPEIELNKGIGVSMLIPDVEIAHEGYTTNAIRRIRFDRNINLMVRDREKYPDRKLGKFLWIRDLAQMCTHEVQERGPYLSEAMKERARVGIKLWEELLEEGEVRMLIDGLEYYTVLATCLDPKFHMAFSCEVVPAHMTVNPNNGVRHLEAKFVSQDHAVGLLKAIIEQKATEHETKYL